MTAEPITVNYLQRQDEWLVVVTAGSTMLTDQAYGLIDARIRADHIVEKLNKSDHPAVVHLLDGDALAFTTAYLRARHGLTEPTPQPASESEEPGVPTVEFAYDDLDDEDDNEDQASTEQSTDHE